MAATEEHIAHDAVHVAAEIVATMEAHAAKGDWDCVEECAVRLKTAILEIPERERVQILRAARQSIQTVQAQAQEARDDVATRLSALRRGKDMAAAYGATD